MPYKKPEPKPFESMTRLLLGYRINAPALAKILGCAPETARKKLNDPQRMTLGDIEKINRFGHISLDELRQAISK